MEYYAPVHGGGGSTFEGDDWHIQHAVASDPAGSGETGLEEGIWQLSMEAQYPERPGEPECVYYMRTGLCSFGMSCRYHHPPNWRALARSKADYPERPSQPECQYYLKTGTCKFGATCKYHHPRDKAAGRVQLNLIGLPWRQGEKECAYYMRTGACKYGVTCKFHHPQPTPVLPPSPAAAWPLRPPLVHSPRLGPSLIIPPPQQGVVPLPGWTTYQGPVSPDPYGGGGPNPNYFLDPYVGLTAAVPKEFPERPGQPECQYYLKTGDCKFGAACRYHHPKDKAHNLPLSSLGLPLRPGAPVCTYYTRNGVCRFGAACKFDHPLLASLTYSPPSMPTTPPYRAAAAVAATFPSSPLCEEVVVSNLSRHSSSSGVTVDSEEELGAKAASVDTTPVSSTTTVQSSSISSDTTSC